MNPRPPRPLKAPSIVPAPVTIPMTEWHLSRLAQLNAERNQIVAQATQAIDAQRSELINSIVSNAYDPASLQGYSSAVIGTDLVLTPPGA